MKNYKYDINRKAAKISVYHHGKIDKYEYLTGEETSPSNQHQIIEQLNLLILLWEKLFKRNQKQSKMKEKIN